MCDHEYFYESNLTRNTVTKKTQCPFIVNVSYLKINNPENNIIINKIVDNHNHLPNRGQIEFEDCKRFTDEMLVDIKFMTENCKFGATA